MNFDGPRILGYSPRIPYPREGVGESSSRVGSGGPCPYGLALRQGWSGPSWRFLMDEKARGPGSVEGPGTDRLRVAKLRSRHLPLAASFIPSHTHTPTTTAGLCGIQLRRRRAVEAFRNPRLWASRFREAWAPEGAGAPERQTLSLGSRLLCALSLFFISVW